MKAVSASASRYAMIHQVLRDAIVNGTARHGLVLLEAPLAELFGTSRVPVRKALDLLHAEGLICRRSSALRTDRKSTRLNSSHT